MNQCNGRCFQLVSLFVICLLSLPLSAAPKAVLWNLWTNHDANSRAVIDHSAWQDFLSEYITDSIEPGVNLVRYSAVTDDDKAKLTAYVDSLEAIDIFQHNRNEQLTYWINLYNAATVELILREYPVSSIRDIRLGGVFSAGPWDTNLLKVNGHALSLNDIEHRILRPIWNDERLHYAVNCASYSCPNLAREAFLSRKVDAQLNAAASAYINHERGVKFRGSELVLSKIYHWYKEDFGNSKVRLLQHLILHAKPELKNKLINHKGKIRYEYHWTLNGAP